MVLAFGPPRPVWKSAHVISQKKSHEMLRHGEKLNQGHGEDIEIHSFSNWAILTGRDNKY